jgi:spore coat protein CotH
VEELNDGGTGLGEENILMRRFFDTPKFLELYDQTYRELFELLLNSGRIDEIMSEVVPPIQAGTADHDLVDPAAFDRAVAGKHSFIASRIEYLLTHPIVAG